MIFGMDYGFLGILKGSIRFFRIYSKRIFNIGIGFSEVGRWARAQILGKFS